MKNRCFIFIVLCLLLSCGREENRTRMAFAGSAVPDYFDGIEMVRVEASTFTFNETKEGRLIEGAAGSFQAVQSSFWISKEPVPMHFFDKYMGPGWYPKYGLSHDDAEKVLDKVYKKTGLPFIIPSESMFEAAVHSGAIEPLSKYRYIVSDGWTMEKQGDGRVRVDWSVPVTGTMVVFRTPYERMYYEHFRQRTNHRLYIVLRAIEEAPSSLINAMTLSYSYKPERSDGREEEFDVNGVRFRMVPVEGGVFAMGATSEQERWANEDEKPLRDVEVKDFKIGQTEVTVALWSAVMGRLPFGNSRQYPDRAVVNVSWYDAQEFILKLSELTGRRFRLPSEEEWEYAARGGNRSKGFVFSGSNRAGDVAVVSAKGKGGEVVRPLTPDVKSRKPNELGLYDMSGNVWEWVRGMYPDGTAIQRGGSRLSLNTACRVSNRQAMPPVARKDTFGFRLAL